MLTVGSFGFILFAALLAGLWRVTPQPRRWQLMLAASLVFYLSLDWQGCLLLCLMTLLVWQAALHLRGSPRWFYVGLAGGIGPADAAQTAPRRLAAGAGVLAAHLGRERAASAGHRVFQPAIDQLPGGRPPGQAGAGIAVRPAALLCVVFSVHHPRAVQPL